MLLSLNLLKKFTPIEKSAEEIADRITLSLTEVEKIEKKGEDTIIEIENKALTHRPDCFSHLGIAREIAAYFNVKCADPLPELTKKTVVPTSSRLELKISVENTELCARYCGVVLTNIKVGPSPDWLKETLENVGIRSINNVVDITNYVMIELGQPLHAFDYDKVEGREIKVRTAKPSEKITTLDGKERELSEEMLVIADQTRAIGVAGVMGGANTEVTNGTTIVLESANFEAKNNRKTSKALNLRSDAATRFEKNLDVNLTYPALVRAVELLQEHASGKVASDVIDRTEVKLNEKRKIEFIPSWINKFLGTTISPEEKESILNRMGIEAKKPGELLELTIPTWRPDITMEADIAEEIARIYGYDNIPTTLPSQTDFIPKKNMDLYWRNKTRTLLMGMGFYENVTNPFIGMELIKKAILEKEEHLQLRNPLSSDQEYMRRNLLPQLLETVKKNLPHLPSESEGNHMRFYEINKLFVPHDLRFGGQGNEQPREPYYLTGVALGDDYRTVKGFVEVLFDELGITNYSFSKYPRKEEERCGFFDNLFHPNKTAQIYNKNSDTEIWGTVGYIHPTVQKNFGIEGELIAFDIPMEMIVKHAIATKEYKPISQYPTIIEDVTIDAKDRELGPIIEKIKQASGLITNVKLVDSFENRYTLRLTFQDPNRNLTQEEVGKIREMIN